MAVTNFTAPSGLSSGQQFRYIFVSDPPGISASSAVQSDYHSAIGASHAQYGYNDIAFANLYAVVSTGASSNAKDILGASDTLPLYNTNGDLVLQGGFDGLWAIESGPITRTAAFLYPDKTSIPPATRIWTGSSADGTVYPDKGLGNANQPQEGDPTDNSYSLVNNAWFSYTSGDAFNESRSVYVITGALTYVKPPCFSLKTLYQVMDKTYCDREFILLSKAKRKDKKLFSFTHCGKTYEVTPDHAFLYYGKVYKFEQLVKIHPLLKRKGAVKEIPFYDPDMGSDSYIFNTYELECQKTPIYEFNQCLQLLGGKITSKHDSPIIAKALKHDTIDAEPSHQSIAEFINDPTTKQSIIYLVKNTEYYKQLE